MTFHKSALYILLASLSFTYSCRKEIDINIDEQENQLVLNAIFIKDSLMSVQLSKSAHILAESPTYPAILDATVSATDQNGQSITFSHTGNGIYSSSQLAQEGYTYQLKAQIPSFENALTSEIKIPTSVAISSLDTTSETVDYGEGNSFQVPLFKLTFQDPADKNYYAIEIIGTTNEYIYNTSGDTIDSTSTKSRLGTFRANGEESDFSFGNILYLSDEKWINTSTILNLKFGYYSESSGLESDRYDVYLHHISPELYLYAKSLSLQSNGFDPFSVPAIAYDNIENGVGVFGGKSTSVYIIE